MKDCILEFLNCDGVAYDPAVFDQIWRDLVVMAAWVRGWLGALDPDRLVLEYLGPGADSTELVFAFGILLVLMIVTLMVMLALVQDIAPGIKTEERAVAATPFLRGAFSGSRADRVPAEPPAAAPEALAEEEGDGAGITVPVLSASDGTGPERKPKPKPKPRPKPKPIAKPDPDQEGDDQVNSEALANIEAEMLTLKELHACGHIGSDEYIAESRALYDRARLFR